MVGVGQNCNDAAKNLYKYVYHRYTQYNNDLVLLVTSFFQSTLSKSLAFTSLYSSIQTKQAANPEDPAIFADFGKILRLLITFEPALVTGGRLLATQEDEENVVSAEREGQDHGAVERYFQKHYLEQLLPGGGGGAGTTTTPPAYTQFYTFNGVLTFIRGLLQGSKFAIAGSKMDLCLNSQTVLITGA